SDDAIGVLPGGNGYGKLITGAYHTTDPVIGYQSMGIDHNLTLHYSSLRADPQPIIHFQVSNLGPTDTAHQQLVAKVDAGVGLYDRAANGIPVANAKPLGLEGGENFFNLPANPQTPKDNPGQGGTVHAALQIDLADGPTGVYHFNLSAGVFTQQG